MRVMSWNVQGAFPPQGSTEQISSQIEYIRDTAGNPDLLMLNEVTTDRRELWRDSLEEIGYREIVDTLDWSHELAECSVPPYQDYNGVNGNLTAIHDESQLRDLTRNSPSISKGVYEDAKRKHWDTNFPEKILNAEVRFEETTIDLWNIRTVPGSICGEEKVKILENTYSRIVKAGSDRCILAGDFNAPKTELEDGTVIPWGLDNEDEFRERWVNAELNILTGLEEYGMVDVFREIYGYSDIETEDVSFQSLRFDHILASKILHPENCYYDHAGLNYSDHAPIIAELRLRS